jgi:hypothetical protein
MIRLGARLQDECYVSIGALPTGFAGGIESERSATQQRE